MKIYVSSTSVDLQVPFPKQIPLADDVILLGYDLTPQPVSTDPAQWVTLYWQAQSNVVHDYVVLLRLLDDQQHEVAYWLGRPVRSGYPSTEWKAGQIVQDPWLLTLPPEVPRGTYQLEIALFDAETEAEISRHLLGEVTWD